MEQGTATVDKPPAQAPATVAKTGDDLYQPLEG